MHGGSLLLILVIATACPVAFCGNCAKDSQFLSVESVSISPQSPVAGGNVTLSFKASLLQEVQDGKVSLDISYLGVKLVQKSLTLCSDFVDSKVACPLSESIVGTATFSLPKHSPQGTYKGRLVIHSTKGERMTCTSFDVPLSARHKAKNKAVSYMHSRGNKVKANQQLSHECHDHVKWCKRDLSECRTAVPELRSNVTYLIDAYFEVYKQAITMQAKVNAFQNKAKKYCGSSLQMPSFFEELRIQGSFVMPDQQEDEVAEDALEDVKKFRTHLRGGTCPTELEVCRIDLGVCMKEATSLLSVNDNYEFILNSLQQQAHILEDQHTQLKSHVPECKRNFCQAEKTVCMDIVGECKKDIPKLEQSIKNSQKSLTTLQSEVAHLQSQYNKLDKQLRGKCNQTYVSAKYEWNPVEISMAAPFKHDFAMAECSSTISSCVQKLDQCNHARHPKTIQLSQINYVASEFQARKNDLSIEVAALQVELQDCIGGGPEHEEPRHAAPHVEEIEEEDEAEEDENQAEEVTVFEKAHVAQHNQQKAEKTTV